jgi:hypothetical protein
MNDRVVVHALNTDKDFGEMKCTFYVDFTPEALLMLLQKFNVQEAVIISGNKKEAYNVTSGLQDTGFVLNRAYNSMTGVVGQLKREIFMLFPNVHATVEKIMNDSLYPALGGRIVQLIIIHNFPLFAEMNEYIDTRLRLN